LELQDGSHFALLMLNSSGSHQTKGHQHPRMGTGSIGIY